MLPVIGNGAELGGKKMTHITRLAIVGIVAVVSLAPIQTAVAEVYTEILDSHAGQEPDLWQVLGDIAPGHDWISTDYLNSGAGGRRVDDTMDAVWQASSFVEVAFLVSYWGLSDQPCDSLGQELVYDSQMLDGTSELFPTPRVDGYGTSAIISSDRPDGMLIFGDESRKPTAWTSSPLNLPLAGGGDDRVISFDVQGLDIYGWTGDEHELLLADAPEGSYILTFDPGVDRDYQDMMVLVQGITPVPEPASAVLLGLGALAAVRVRGRRRVNRR